LIIHQARPATKVTRSVVATGAALLLFALGGCAKAGHVAATGSPIQTFSLYSAPAFSPQPTYSMPTDAAQALEDLDRLAVQSAPSAGPMPAGAFGATKKVGGASCTSHDVILSRDLRNIAFSTGSTCRVASGVLFDPYTAKWAWFSRTDALNQVDLDYVVPLQNAWQTGAANWGNSIRNAFANDPLELRAAAAATIAAKAERDASAWLPPDAAFKCAYVIDQIEVKVKYMMSVLPAEKDAMSAALTTCQTAPVTPSPTTSPPPQPTPTKVSHSHPKPSASKSKPSPSPSKSK
jgi:Protein of unknown function (DUF1524)